MSIRRGGGGPGVENRRGANGSSAPFGAARQRGARALLLRRGMGPRVASIAVSSPGVMRRMTLRVGGCSSADARYQVSPSGDADRGFIGHGHIRAGSVTAEKGKEGVGLLAV